MLTTLVFFIAWGSYCSYYYKDDFEFMQMWLSGTGIFLIVTGLFDGL